MERSRGDPQDVVGLDRAKARHYRGAFDDRQQVTLHALARDVRSGLRPVAGHLVDLVQENDTGLLNALRRLPGHLVEVDQLVGLFLREQAPRLLHGDLPAAPAAARHRAQDLLEAVAHIVARHARDELEDGVIAFVRLQLDLDDLLVQLIARQPFRHMLARLLATLPRHRCRRGLRATAVRGPSSHRRHDGRGGLLAGAGLLGRARRGLLFGDHALGQDVEDALFRLLRRLLAHLRHALVMPHANRRVHEIAHNRIDIAADIADLRELGGLNFDEGRVGDLGQPARDFRFAYPSRPNHEDVLRRDLRLYLDGQREAAIAVTQRNSYRPLRLVLPNNIAVQLPNNMLGSQVSHRTRLLSEPTLQTSSVHGCRVDAGHSFG